MRVYLLFFFLSFSTAFSQWDQSDGHKFAYRFDRDFDFYENPNGFLENSFGWGEKWVISEAQFWDQNPQGQGGPPAFAPQWFFILPSGDIYKYDRNDTEGYFGELMANLGSGFHTNPRLLFNVPAPADIALGQPFNLDGDSIEIDLTSLEKSNELLWAILGGMFAIVCVFGLETYFRTL